MSSPITPPAASSPYIPKIVGNRGNSTRKPAEIRHFKAHKHVTPDDGVTGNTAPGDGPDPFAELTDADRARASAIPSGGGADDDGELTILPCPGQVPQPSAFRFGDLPEPSHIWTYRTAEGATVAVAVRYDGTAADGTPTKDVRPWTYGRRVWTDRNGKAQDRTGWHCKAPPSPRPLYGLDRLAARWDAPVVVCEGEKAADAAGLLFPNHVAVTSQGGSKAPGKADWTPLRGRAVTIWPDQDKAGADYAVTVADLAKQAGSASVRMVEVPPGWPEGWDLADDLPAGVAPGRLRELLDNSPEDTPPPAGDEDEPQAEAAPGTDPPAGAAELRALLSVEAWAERDIPAPDRLLGDLITRTTRMFLVGRTGLGKTLLGLAIAAGVASGKGFLDLPSSRPARVLYLDGEMPAELIKPRAADAMRRLGVTIPAENLLIFGRDIEAEARRVCPSLPEFGPLNTDDGGQFMLALLEAIGGVDLIIFDNVMSLIAGSMKDEEAWLATVPLVTWLTGKQIGQLWLDHTGHNTDRQYGTSTKAWQFDAVGQMTPVADEKPDPRATAFTLSFDYPGKARRRTPDNWAEFQARIIRLVDDQWVFEPVNPQADRKPTPLRPGARAQYDALLDALAVSPTPRRTTRTIWYAECVRLGLADAIGAEDTPTTREKKMGTFRAHLSQLKVAGWIGCDGETITSLKGAG